MSVVLVTGSAGLVGSQTVRHFAARGMDVAGVDNCMREQFFGPDGSVRENLRQLCADLGPRYRHHAIDIRDRDELRDVFERYGSSISLIVHAAAQPSHNWAAKDPWTDFGINATGTLNVLEYLRRHCPDAVFIYCGSSTVYGDRLNDLPFVEHATRWDLDETHPAYEGLPESAPVDQTKHTLFGVSKLAGDILTQEYGRYFGLRTVVLRCGQVCGPALAATREHGMPAFVMRSAMERREYTITGFAGKQVRDLIHPDDLLSAFEAISQRPVSGKVFNIGGGRQNAFSVIELLDMAGRIASAPIPYVVAPGVREGDRKWWITNSQEFARHYPEWRVTRSTSSVMAEICQTNVERWHRSR